MTIRIFFILVISMLALHTPSNRWRGAGVPVRNRNFLSYKIRFWWPRRSVLQSTFFAIHIRKPHAHFHVSSQMMNLCMAVAFRARQQNPAPSAFFLRLLVAQQCAAFKASHYFYLQSSCMRHNEDTNQEANYSKIHC